MRESIKFLSLKRNQKEYRHMELLFSLIGTSLSAVGFYAVHYIIKIAEKNES